jgi:hypothetical protein
MFEREMRRATGMESIYIETKTREGRGRKQAHTLMGKEEI